MSKEKPRGIASRMGNSDGGVEMSWIDELKIGDTVAKIHGRYATFSRGTVVEITQKIIKVKFKNITESFLKSSGAQRGFSNDWYPPKIAEWTEIRDHMWKLQTLQTSIFHKLKMTKNNITAINEIERLQKINNTLEDILNVIREGSN